MNIYVHEKGILLAGKAWEIRKKLKEYAEDYQFISDWVESYSENTSDVSYHKPTLIINNKKNNH
jgi:hypothetical protein